METKNNKTKMETLILKRGDLSLTYSSYRDSYFLFYKDVLFLECEFDELFVDELRLDIFEIEPDRNNAADFIITLYDWGSAQQEALEELLDSVYGEEKQLNDEK